MVRPIVLVYQELAQATVTPTVPDLNCLVVGPAYHIRDYPADKNLIEVSNYGTLNADNPYTPPVAGTAAITLAAPPDIIAGAWVDPASVTVHFDECRVIIGSGADGTTVTTAPNENRFESAGATFVTDGVSAGDVLIVDNPAGPATPNLALTILSVESETQLRVATNFTAAVSGSLNWRIERQLADHQIASSHVVTPVYRTSNQVTILGGVTLPVDDFSRVVSYARVFVAYRAYRTDLQTLDSASSTDEILSKVGRIDARNPLAAATFVAKQNAGRAPVQFYGVESPDLVGYNKAKDAISTDESVYAVVPLTADLNVLSAFKADNEALADPSSALSNGVPQKFRVVIGSGDLTRTQAVVSEKVTGTAEALAGAVPPGTKTINLTGLTALTSNLRPGDQLILSASENVAPLDGTYTIAHINSETQLELNEALPVVVSSAEGINYRVFRPSTNSDVVPLVDGRAKFTSAFVEYISRVAGVTPGARTIALVEDSTTTNGIHSIVEVAGVSTVVNGHFASNNITAAMLVAAINTGAGVTVPFSGSVNIVARGLSTVAPQTVFAATALSTGVAGTDTLTSTTALDAVYVRLFDSSATFITDGVMAGDIIEIPTNPNGVFGAQSKQYTVNTVISEQRLEIANISAGSYQNNTSTVEHELPHTDNRMGTGTPTVQGTIRYRVVRNLTKDQQVADLVTRAQSLSSRRAILCWPDSVEVAGLVDGSLPPNSDGSAAAAGPQPGYYMAAVVGGMTAGLPSHQGFSRLGCAGISRIYHSNDYFTDRQLTQLSDGGWYVFAQASPSSLPYSIHQLTTDPATLESGEYSIVKNFDFVSLFFLDILEPFLGVWNINTDTMGFIRQALNTGIENLKLRRVAKIGSPLNDATITSIDTSPASADRVEVYMEVDLPKPLNVIGLHLVA